MHTWIRASLATGLFGMLIVAGSSRGLAQQPQAPPQPMGFFVTSVGVGNGGNLGGLDGADKHCQTLAAAAGAGNRTWRAYLSTAAAGGQPPCMRASVSGPDPGSTPRVN
jgi:hypothetical protein